MILMKENSQRILMTFFNKFLPPMNGAFRGILGYFSVSRYEAFEGCGALLCSLPEVTLIVSEACPILLYAKLLEPVWTRDMFTKTFNHEDYEPEFSICGTWRLRR